MRLHFIATAATILFHLCLPQSPSAMQTSDCLGCHGQIAAVSARQYIDPERFAATAHAQMGCPVCHDAVAEQHPGDGLEPNKARCGDCHEQVAAEYAHSLHGINASCGDCHNPHMVRSPTEVSGFAMNRRCARCHSRTDTLETHRRWLPQTETHFLALPCITCHTGSKEYVITFYLVPRKRDGSHPLSHAQLRNDAAEQNVERLVDPDGDDFVSLEELRSFQGSKTAQEVRLQAMMVPEHVAHSFDILDTRRDCSSCHAAGPGIGEVNYLALPRPDGTFWRLPLEERAVRAAFFGTPDFYMMGAGRSRALDLIGAILVCSGLALPLGHGLLRLLVPGKQRRK